MPSVSRQQQKAMFAAAEGHSTLGIPKKVGQEFVNADLHRDDAKHEPVSESQRKAMYAAAEGESKLGIPKDVGEEFVGRQDASEVVCAGIMLRAPGPAFLLLRNADDGQWVQPGGHVDPGETVRDAAVRECAEEIGSVPDGEMWMLRESHSGGVSFTCFLMDVNPKDLDVKIDDESLAWGWFHPDNLPHETHPEVVKSIQLVSGTELHAAKGIQSGELASPQKHENIWLFAVRITGTGVSYRAGLDEYVQRPAEHFLSDEFLERCVGLPLIFEHPTESILTTEEFRDRSIGTVILPYIKDDEVWGIAKVFDHDAAQLMRTTHVSTSPAVVFRDAGSTKTLELDDGSTVLVEGKPSYLDHLAICQEGVWDKGGEPTGVNLDGDHSVTDEKEAAPAWADALGRRLDEVCARMDSIENKGGDKWEQSGDGEPGRFEEERADSEKAAEKAGEAEDKDEKKAVAEDKKAEKEERRAEKDTEKSERDVEAAEKEGKKELKAERKDSDGEYMDAQKRENAELREMIASMEKQLKGISTPLSAGERDALSAAQARADGVFQLFGDRAPAPLAGEKATAYRSRLVSRLQKHSASLKDVKMDSVTGAAFDHLEEKIYADAQESALRPVHTESGRLIPIVRKDSAGREITEFTGDPMSWMQHFMSGANIAHINKNHGSVH